MKYVSLLLLYVQILFYKISCVEGILGGFVAKSIDRFKYQVSVRVNNIHRCGGVVIGQKYVLTAAHCVITPDQKFLNIGELSVLGGITNILLESHEKKEGAVKKIYVPAEYKYINFKESSADVHTSGDIALLKLKTELGISENGIAKLPATSFLTYEYETPVVSGFGLSYINTDSMDYKNKRHEHEKYIQLKYAETNVILNSKCQSLFPITISPNHLCAQVKQNIPQVPEGTCLGDSGGPLILNGKTVIGILSIGPPSCDERIFPSIYTRVGSFLPFIQKAMRDESSRVIRVADCEATKKLFGLFGSKTNVVEKSVIY